MTVTVRMVSYGNVCPVSILVLRLLRKHQNIVRFYDGAPNKIALSKISVILFGDVAESGLLQRS